jgi:hypothetical protein
VISMTVKSRTAHWCREVAAMRIHGTTRNRGAARAASGARQGFRYPTWIHPKVAPDRHVQIAKALYSVPGELVGKRLDARADAHTGETVLAW